MSKSSPGSGILGRLPPSTRPYKAEGSAPISSFAQYDPVIIEHMLNSEDPAKRRDAFMWLVNYLREHGRVLPVLAMLADWLDPEATAAPFRLTINRRRKGQRRTVDQMGKDAEIADSFAESRKQGIQRKSKGKLAPKL